MVLITNFCCVSEESNIDLGNSTVDTCSTLVRKIYGQSSQKPSWTSPARELCQFLDKQGPRLRRPSSTRCFIWTANQTLRSSARIPWRNPVPRKNRVSFPTNPSCSSEQCRWQPSKKNLQNCSWATQQIPTPMNPARKTAKSSHPLVSQISY